VSSGRESSDVPWRAAWQQASNFQEWSGKRVPLLLRGHSGKSLVAEVQFEEIKPLPAQLSKDFFAPAPGATTWADCGGRAAWKIKDRVRPEYPQSARIRHREGTVVLSAIIEADRSRRSSVEVQDSSFDLSGIEPVRSFVGIAVALRTYACMFWRPRLDRNVHRRCVLARAVKRYPPSASGQALSRVPG